jgi:hypothetical protein
MGDSLSCKTTAIRDTDFPNPYDPQSDYEFFVEWFLASFADAFLVSLDVQSEPSALLIWLNDPSQSPFIFGWPDFRNLNALGTDELALRLEQILNTCWIGVNAFASICRMQK